MGKVVFPSNYDCFNENQKRQYASLPQKYKNYVSYRGLGYSKNESYRMCGYGGKNVSQGVNTLEKRNPELVDLANTIIQSKVNRDLFIENSNLNQKLDIISKGSQGNEVLAKIEKTDSETAKRIKFYRDIINGKIKSVKIVTRYNSAGEIIDKKVEESNDVQIKITARKELDKILGINQLVNIDELKMGDITINIVDASRKDELQDSRNNPSLDIDKLQNIDGQEVIVEEAEVVKDD